MPTVITTEIFRIFFSMASNSNLYIEHFLNTQFSLRYEATEKAEKVDSLAGIWVLLIITLSASCGAVYCNRSSLWVCLCVGQWCAK